MKRSANEIAGLVLKAARGAGLPLGACEDLARAAPILAEQDRLGSALECLQMKIGLPVLEDRTFAAGHPVLVAVSALDLQMAGLAVEVHCAMPAGVMAAMKDARHGAVATGPIEVGETLWRDLTAYAERIFVPETDASRLAGAGAGLTDND